MNSEPQTSRIKQTYMLTPVSSFEAKWAPIQIYPNGSEWDKNSEMPTMFQPTAWNATVGVHSPEPANETFKQTSWKASCHRYHPSISKSVLSKVEIRVVLRNAKATVCPLLPSQWLLLAPFKNEHPKFVWQCLSLPERRLIFAVLFCQRPWQIKSGKKMSLTQVNSKHVCLGIMSFCSLRLRDRWIFAEFNEEAWQKRVWPKLGMMLVAQLPWKQCVSGILPFFPRASERRVLPIVGVCISSSRLHICSSSHLLIFTSSHLHICSSSHLLIFTSAHLHICSSSSAHLYTCSSSHLLIFTSSHLHTFSSSHLLIFTSAHLHICSSSHLLIFTPAHLHIFSSSHLLIFTPSHLHICSSSHLLIFTSAHLHICSSSHLIFTPSLTPSHLHICSSSHLLIFTSAPLHIFSSSHLLSFLSPFSLSRLLYLSLFRPRVVPAGSHETSTLSHEMRIDRQKLR